VRRGEKLLAYLIIVIDYTKVQALKFFLKSELNKIMGCSICSACVLLAVQPVISVEILILSTGADVRGIEDRGYRKS
jgi:hypothetical protein